MKRNHQNDIIFLERKLLAKEKNNESSKINSNERYNKLNDRFTSLQFANKALKVENDKKTNEIVKLYNDKKELNIKWLSSFI